MIYFQIFTTFRYKSLKNSEIDMGLLEKLPDWDTNLPTNVKELGEQIVKSGQKTGEKLGQSISDAIDSIIDYIFD